MGRRILRRHLEQEYCVPTRVAVGPFSEIPVTRHFARVNPVVEFNRVFDVDKRDVLTPSLAGLHEYRCPATSDWSTPMFDSGEECYEYNYDAMLHPCATS